MRKQNKEVVTVRLSPEELSFVEDLVEFNISIESVSGAIRYCIRKEMQEQGYVIFNK